MGYCVKDTSYWTQNRLSRIVYLDILCPFLVGGKGEDGLKYYEQAVRKGWGGEVIQKKLIFRWSNFSMTSYFFTNFMLIISGLFPYLTPHTWKHQENLRFSDVFRGRGVKKEASGIKWVQKGSCYRSCYCYFQQLLIIKCDSLYLSWK